LKQFINLFDPDQCVEKFVGLGARHKSCGWLQSSYRFAGSCCWRPVLGAQFFGPALAKPERLQPSCRNSRIVARPAPAA